MKKLVPLISDLLIENFTPGVDYKIESATSDEQKLTDQVNTDKKALDTLMQDGKSDYNTINNAIIKYIDSISNLNYLKLASQIKPATVPEPQGTPAPNQQSTPITNQQGTANQIPT